MIFIRKTQNLFIIIFFLLLSGCGSFSDIDWSKRPEVSGKERARKNVQEGRGITLGNFGKVKQIFYSLPQILYGEHLLKLLIL